MSVFDRILSVIRPSTHSHSICLGATGLALAAGSAQATWSILITDTRTGEIVIASATCVELIDLRRETPVLISGVGAVTAQSAVDTSGRNRLLIRDRLLQGVPLEAILEELSMTDAGHGNRQYGMINVSGQTLTYSGVQNADWAGGITGRIEKGRPGPADDIVYTVQGNILSGLNVVQDAVDAIVAADTDLPGRLMAGMIAGRFGGGDGRCSCSPAAPTGCGSPPPGDFKSADVGYMLGTRADNIDSVRVAYPVPVNISDIALIDLDGDGIRDVVAGNQFTDELFVFMNSALPGDPLSHVIPGESLTASGTGVVAMSAGDFNGDGLEDLAIVLTSPSRLEVRLGIAGGGLAEPRMKSLSSLPTGMDVGRLDASGTDRLVVSESTGRIEILGVHKGNPVLLDTILNAGNDISDVHIAQLSGDALEDIAILSKTDSTVLVFERTGDLSFAPPSGAFTANAPVKLRSADMDLDGDNELVVLSESGRRAQVFENDGFGTWSMISEVITNRDGRGLAVGVFNPDDEYPDIITTSSFANRNMQLFLNNGDGTYTLDSLVKVGSGARTVLLYDMNGSGDLDLVVGNGGDEGLILLDNPRGSDLPKPGRFADGDYFLELNIPNQRRDDPDPVEQLQKLFDAWRAGLDGKVDAVHSTAQGRHRISTSSSSTLTIELRDWQGALLPITDPGGWSLESVDGFFEAAAPTMLSPGVFEVVLEANELVSPDKLIVRIGDGADQIRLMPDFDVYIVENIADFTADGVLNFYDVSAFLVAYFAGDPDADLNGDGALDFNDVSLFLAAFSG